MRGQRLRSTVSVGDLVSDVVAVLRRRRARTMLTGLSIVIGAGSLVVTIGLSAAAHAQIERRFDALRATEVIVHDNAPDDRGFPDDAEAAARRVDGVLAAGRWWPVAADGIEVRSAPIASRGSRAVADVRGASPEALMAMGPALSSGRLLTAADVRATARVAVVGGGLARRLHLPPTAALDQRAVWIDGVPFTVVGVLANADRRPEALVSIVVPSTTALALWRRPRTDSVSMVVHVRSGDAERVARQLPLALRPDQPSRFSALVPPDPRQLRASVGGDVSSLTLVLGAASIVLGAIGIGNTTLVSVVERTGEIGLRRALGARKVHIAAQFLGESGVVGAVGGVVGAIGGSAVVVAICVARGWPLVASAAPAMTSAALGALVGLVAGVHPALRAAAVQPVEALAR